MQSESIVTCQFSTKPNKEMHFHQDIEIIYVLDGVLEVIFEKEEKMGTILITGWLEDEVLVLIVSDDGVGISEDKLKIILTGAGESISGSNIGIYNTHERLQLFYNNTDFGLAYSSNEGNGTEVEIRIPAKKISV